MSRELGNELPGALLSLLDGRDLPGRMAKAILMATVDTNGHTVASQITHLSLWGVVVHSASATRDAAPTDSAC